MKKLNLNAFKEHKIIVTRNIVGGFEDTTLNGQTGGDAISGDTMYVNNGNGGYDTYCRIGSSSNFGSCGAEQ